MIFLYVFCFYLTQVVGGQEILSLMRSVHSGPDISETSLVILGTVQDGGSPHIGCTRECCKDLFERRDENRKVVSIGLVIPDSDQIFLFEATPDMPSQMKMLKGYASAKHAEVPDGVFLTHAHIGHYSGLMYFGREAMGAKHVPVFAMPRLKTFLEQNGPWSQLVSYENISIEEMMDGKTISLTSHVNVTPFLVPHRDEYSETVGFLISGPNKKALFIPDIDKWEKWGTSIIETIAEVDYAFVDGTFYDGNELPNRDISEIPHPFVIESMELFRNLPLEEKRKIYFLHFNHTNPALSSMSIQSKQILDSGFHIAQIHDIIAL